MLGIEDCRLRLYLINSNLMAKSALYVKLVLDSLFIISCVLLLWAPIFTYMYSAKVYLTSISLYFAGYELEGLDGSAACDELGVKQVCDLFESFIWAGVVFIAFIVLALVSAGLSLVSLFSHNLKIKNKLFRGKFYHVLYPLFFILGFVVYSLISGVFSLKSYGFGKDYEMNWSSGLYLIFFMILASIGSLVSFCFVKTFCVLDVQEKLLNH